jgi:sugar phosphate isomerase/epimerase
LIDFTSLQEDGMEPLSMYRHMRLGIVHFKAFPEVEFGQGKMLDGIKKIAEDDFWTAIEIGPSRDVRVRNQVRQILEVSHLTVCYATQPTVLGGKLNPNSLDQAERRRAISALKSCVDEAYDVGASYVRLLSGKDPGDAKREEAKRIFADSLREVLDYAKQEGDMRFTLKVFDRSIDKCSLIGHFSDAADLGRALCPEYPNFGLLADLSHFPLLGERPEDAIPLVKGFPLHFHLGNCVMRDRRHPCYGDLQPRFGIPGGEVDVPQVRDYFRLLLEHRLLDPKDPPVVSVEVRPLLAEEYSEIIIANAKRVVRQAWATQ